MSKMLRNDSILKTGAWYWYKHIADKDWQVCRILEDQNENQFLAQLGMTPLSLNAIDVSKFDFICLEPPQVGNAYLFASKAELYDEIRNRC